MIQEKKVTDMRSCSLVSLFWNKAHALKFHNILSSGGENIRTIFVIVPTKYTFQLPPFQTYYSKTIQHLVAPCFYTITSSYETRDIA